MNSNFELEEVIIKPYTEAEAKKKKESDLLKLGLLALGAVVLFKVVK